MYPQQHVIFGFLLALLLLFLFPEIGLLGAATIFLSSFLIDIDHYIYSAIKRKDYNPISIIKWHYSIEKKFLGKSRKERSKYWVGWNFLHGFEILLLLLIFSFIFSIYFFYIFIGFLFHLIPDWIKDYSYQDRLDKVSIVYDYFKYKKLKHIDILF